MLKFKIQTQVWIVVGLLSVIILGLTAYSYHSEKSLGSDLEEIAISKLPAVRDATMIDMFHEGIRGLAFRAMYMSKNGIDAQEKDELLKNVKGITDDVESRFTSLKKIDLESDLKKDLAEIEPIFKDYVNNLTTLVNNLISLKNEEALKSLAAVEITFKILEIKMDVFGEKIKKSAELSSEAGISNEKFALKMGIIVSIISVLLGLILAALMIKNLQSMIKSVINRLSSESSELDSSSHQLKEASQKLASAVTEQASALQETAASLEEIVAMVAKTSENAKDLEGSANQSLNSAESGKSSVIEMQGAVQEINVGNQKMSQEVENSNTRIGEIMKFINEIGAKTKVIHDIVFQTKLLSFNASVEAARAGEHGKGFAVVAEEVGNLAAMSGKAAEEISHMLEKGLTEVEKISKDNRDALNNILTDMTKRLTRGNQVLVNCQKSMDEILTFSQQVQNSTSEISRASEEQNLGIAEISKAINELEKVTHLNSQASGETAQYSDQLLTRAQELRSSVHDLELLI